MNWLNGLTDGQVVGGLLFVVVPLVLLGLMWLEGWLEARAAARAAAPRASTRARRFRAVGRGLARRVARGSSLTWTRGGHDDEA